VIPTAVITTYIIIIITRPPSVINHTQHFLIRGGPLRTNKSGCSLHISTHAPLWTARGRAGWGPPGPASLGAPFAPSQKQT
jgi:hypothetical protein